MLICYCFRLQEYVNSGQLAEADMDTVLLSMGQPFMEVFLRKDEDSGGLRSCTTAILPDEASQASTRPSLSRDLDRPDDHMLSGVAMPGKRTRMR